MHNPESGANPEAKQAALEHATQSARAKLIELGQNPETPPSELLETMAHYYRALREEADTLPSKERDIWFHEDRAITHNEAGMTHEAWEAADDLLNIIDNDPDVDVRQQAQVTYDRLRALLSQADAT